MDVLVLGAGPAGALCAGLLARLGHSVLLLEGPRTKDRIVETIPESALDFLDLKDTTVSVEASRTIWWGTDEPEREFFTDPRQRIHIERSPLECLLLDYACVPGVRVLVNRHAPAFDLPSGTVQHDHGITKARFIVDATGRAGLLARQTRRFWDDRFSTIGVCAIVAGPFDAGLGETLVEAFDHGWGWSVPMATDRRYICLMLEAGAVRAGSEAAFRQAFDSAVNLRRGSGDPRLDGPVMSRDTSLYQAERYAGSNWILIGDAGFFADPIASNGVENAIRSARAGAEAVHATLTNPAAAESELVRFDAGERAVYEQFRMDAARRSEAAASFFGTGFWTARASA